MVSANSPNKEAAWDYIRWLDDNGKRMAWAEETGEIPAVPELWKDPAIAESKRFGQWLPYLEFQVPLLHIGPQDEYSTILNNMVSSVLFQQSTVDDALATAELQINEMLARTVQ
jgi:ABC-type glycerol-3-phosphate transport system substrate-binding protein